MQAMVRSVLLSWLVLVGCGSGLGRTRPREPGRPSVTASCDERQKALSREADRRASPHGIDAHVEKHFKDRRVSWLMTDAAYQQLLGAGARHFGRCDDSGCFRFAAPKRTIEEALERSRVEGRHDRAVLGRALGLPAGYFEGRLWMMTLDLAASNSCARLPVEEDLGVWKCATPEDTDCFKFGGYTSGNVPELIVINAPVELTQVVEVP